MYMKLMNNVSIILKEILKKFDMLVAKYRYSNIQKESSF